MYIYIYKLVLFNNIDIIIIIKAQIKKSFYFLRIKIALLLFIWVGLLFAYIKKNNRPEIIFKYLQS